MAGFNTLALLVNTYAFIILVRVVIDTPYFLFHSALMPLFKVTEPVLSPLERVTPRVRGRSLAPVVVAVVLYLLLFGAGIGFVGWTPLLSAFVTITRVVDFFCVAYLAMFVFTIPVPDYAGNAVGNIMYGFLAPIRELLVRVTRNRWVVAAGGCLIVLAVHYGISFALDVGLSAFVRRAEVLPLLQLRQSLQMVGGVFSVYWALILFLVIASFARMDRGNPWVLFLSAIMDPLLRPFRRFIPPVMGFDLSPIFVIVIMGWLQGFWVMILHQLIPVR